jgi:hypothetical protein
VIPPWVKAHRQWANAKVKSSIYDADVAGDILTMFARNAVPHAATEKPKP